MGKISVHEFISLDGVFENPAWTAPYGMTHEMMGAIGALTASSSAILLGRRTYELFAPAWSARTVEQDPGAAFFNDTTKYVVSSTLPSADAWQNSQLFGGYDPSNVRELKERVDGGVYISGSGQLVRALLATGWSTSCTCSPTRSYSAPEPGSSRTTPHGPRSRWRASRRTTTASST